MKRLSGFVLITVLIFIQILSLTSLYGFMLAKANMRSNDHLWQGYQYRLQGHKFLQQREAKIGQERVRCAINIVPAPILAQQSIEWWQLNTCSANVAGISYYYAVEFLGDDPCGVIGTNDNKQLLIASYYRISLYLVPDKLKGAKYLLQSTVALPVLQTIICQNKLHAVKSGRQMWREL